MNDFNLVPAPDEASESRSPTWSRRSMMLAAAGVAASMGAARWLRLRVQKRPPVFIASRQSYDARLVCTMRDGLIACGLTPDLFRNRHVLLKPNMVEPTRDVPHMTTHPTVILAAAEVFLEFGARVTVGEAPGHVRDTEMALVESGVAAALDSMKLPFADLNYEQVSPVKNLGRISGLDNIWFPRSVQEADWVVSMPKMKTHHWVGVTLSMKNLYGTLPGIKYGWPKNVLHHNGIPQTVFDINATLPRAIAIVDGIDCMEGDGPIMGSAKHMGLVAIGPNPTAVDATLSRIMGFDPMRISYLCLSHRKLASLDDADIDQRGERWQELVSPFQIMDRPHLRKIRSTGPLVS